MQLNLNRWQKRRYYQCAPSRWKRITASFFLFFTVMLLQLNPRASLLQNLMAIYKLTAAKFRHFPNSHRGSRARQCRATHTPRTPLYWRSHSAIFVWYPPQNRLGKLSNLKQFVFEITFTNYLTKIFFINGKNNNGITTNNYHHSELREDFYMQRGSDW